MGILKKAVRKVIIRRKEVDSLTDDVQQLKRLVKKQNALLEALQGQVFRHEQDLNGVYKLLYDQVHNLEESRPIGCPNSENATSEAFAKQWQELPVGNYLLSDPWFRDNVDRILSEEELQIKRDWFAGKKVLDAGCGNGRWAYGFSKLGADLTCMDVNTSAIEATKQALSGFKNPQRFIQTPLEDLLKQVEPGSFDLAFSWGVIHHCKRYLDALAQVAGAVKPGGILYLYLYGRESLSLVDDLAVFKQRVAYNFLMNDAERMAFLEERVKAGGESVHNYHDVYAPLLNRRLTFEAVEAQLQALGFSQITQTISHTELFIRAVKEGNTEDYTDIFLPKKQPPYWFTHHQQRS